MELKLPLTYQSHYEQAHGINWKDRYFIQDSSGRIIAAELTKSVAELFVHAVNAEEAHRNLLDKAIKIRNSAFPNLNITAILSTGFADTIISSEKALGIEGKE